MLLAITPAPDAAAGAGALLHAISPDIIEAAQSRKVSSKAIQWCAIKVLMAREEAIKEREKLEKQHSPLKNSPTESSPASPGVRYDCESRKNEKPSFGILHPDYPWVPTALTLASVRQFFDPNNHGYLGQSNF